MMCTMLDMSLEYNYCMCIEHVKSVYNTIIITSVLFSSKPHDLILSCPTTSVQYSTRH